jgi:hypothetical protein
VNLTYNEPKNEAFLQIASVKIDDEATYKCEITYLEVVENCGDVQIVKLTTLGKCPLNNDNERNCNKSNAKRKTPPPQKWGKFELSKIVIDFSSM